MPTAVKTAAKSARSSNAKVKSRRQPAKPALPRTRKALAADASDRFVDGVRVVSEEPLPSPLTKALGRPVNYTGFRLLNLENGRQAFGCADCEFAGTRGEVQRHRAEQHGAGFGGRRKSKVDLPPPIAEMTLGQVLTIAVASDGWGAQYETLEARCQGWKERALAAEEHNKKVTAALKKAGFSVKVEE